MRKRILIIRGFTYDRSNLVRGVRRRTLAVVVTLADVRFLLRDGRSMMSAADLGERLKLGRMISQINGVCGVLIWIGEESIGPFGRRRSNSGCGQFWNSSDVSFNDEELLRIVELVELAQRKHVSRG